MTLYDKLVPYAKTIKAEAVAGNELARRVILLYELHHKSPFDPGAQGLCEAALDAWLEKRTKP